MYRLVRLAFETDSTRVVTLMLDSVSTPVVEISGTTISDGYHNLSHHGKSEAKLAQLRTIDSWHMRLLADLFKGLKAVEESGEALLDRAMVLYGSNRRMPIRRRICRCCWGRRVPPRGHLAFDRNQNYPLLIIRVHAAAMGIEAKFASSTGTMQGFERQRPDARHACRWRFCWAPRPTHGARNRSWWTSKAPSRCCVTAKPTV
jgi:hypothetical protein